MIKGPACQHRASRAKLQAHSGLATYIFSCFCCKIHSYHDWHSLSWTSDDSNLVGKKTQNVASHFQKLLCHLLSCSCLCVSKLKTKHAFNFAECYQKKLTGVLLMPCVSVISMVPKVFHSYIIFPKLSCLCIFEVWSLIFLMVILLISHFPYLWIVSYTASCFLSYQTIFQF